MIASGLPDPVPSWSGRPSISRPVEGETPRVSRAERSTHRSDEGGLTRRAAFLAGAATAAPAALALSGGSAHAAEPVPPARGWIDVTDAAYGAKGDDVADDGPALQKAFDACKEGGTVYLPAGEYRTAQMLHINKRNITIRGSHAARWPYRAGAPSCIKPHGSFTGKALLRIQDKEEVPGRTEDIDGVRLVDLAFNGTRHEGGGVAGGVNGLYSTGQVRDLRIEGCTFWTFTGHCVNVAPYTRQDGRKSFAKGWRLTEVTCWNTRGEDVNGFHLDSLTDAQLTDCLAGDTATGFYHVAPGDVTYTSCRSVFNRKYGYHVDRYCDGVIYNGCSTDRNGSDGWLLTARGGNNRPVLLSGCYARRDGHSPVAPDTGAGLRVKGASATALHPPVVLSGFVATTGVSDENDGPRSPVHGVHYTQGRFLGIGGGFLEGTEAGLYDVPERRAKVDASVQVQRYTAPLP
ncbi:hypothetical protein FF041_10025 [Streptomyces jumonjinensis]|uniref:Rhamnogalacturonase A/B/Epimerase-like pectate lyase domain-containing protein n=1 Tax=Streptomyces jumonjinensis TaxID=1945 RepID=A0A646KE44_STRJU|nr:hypothetical protein [Streptomyces jumonjinensis]